MTTPSASRVAYRYLDAYDPADDNYFHDLVAPQLIAALKKQVPQINRDAAKKGGQATVEWYRSKIYDPEDRQLLVGFKLNAPSVGEKLLTLSVEAAGMHKPEHFWGDINVQGHFIGMKNVSGPKFTYDPRKDAQTGADFWADKVTELLSSSFFDL